MNFNIMKLFRQILKLGKVETPEGILIFEGDVLVEGTEVFIEDAEGNIIPAPDGMYGDYKVVDGKVAPKEEEVVEEPTEPEVVVEQEEVVVEEPTEPETPEETPNEVDERIARLEQEIADLKTRLDELTKKYEDMEFKSMKPAEKEVKDIATEGNKGALKYFSNK